MQKKKRFIFLLILYSFILISISNLSTQDAIKEEIFPETPINFEKNDPVSSLTRIGWYPGGGRVTSVAISGDGRYTVYGSEEVPALIVYDRDSASQKWAAAGPDPEAPLLSADISANGNTIVAGYKMYQRIIIIIPQNYGYIRVYDISSNSYLWQYDTDNDVRSVAVSDDGSRIVSGDSGDRIRYYTRTGGHQWSRDIGSDVYSVAISGDGNYIVGGGSNDNVYLFHRSSSTPEWTSTHPSGDIQEVDISEDGQYIVAASSDGYIRLWGRGSSTPIWSYNAPGSCSAVAISADGNYIIGSTAAGMTYFFHRSSSVPIWSYNLRYGVSSKAVAISDDGEYATVGSSGKTVYVFDKYASASKQPHRMGKVNGTVRDVDISQNGLYVSAGDNEGKFMSLFTNPYAGGPGDPKINRNYITLQDDIHTPINSNDIKIPYDMSGLSDSDVIVTGVRYGYFSSSDSGNSSLIYGVGANGVGDQNAALHTYTDNAVPFVNVTGHDYVPFRTYLFTGDTYLIDDDPYFIIENGGASPYVTFCADAETFYSGVSYSRNAGSTGVFTEYSGHAFYVDMMFEVIRDLEFEVYTNGTIDSSDYIDAFFIDMLEGREYEFTLFMAGEGNLDMRLVQYNTLTNVELIKSSGDVFPKVMTHNSTYTGKHVLLVQADVPGTDVAGLTVKCVDKGAPKIVIITPPPPPAPSAAYKYTPQYNLNITGLDLNKLWYNVNDGPNITIDNSTSPGNYTGFIDSDEWDPLPDGPVTINFYLDTLGSPLGESTDKESVVVIKDTSPPIITINSPLADETHGNSPDYDITIIDDQLQNYWYTLNDSQDYPLSSQTGKIDSGPWAAIEPMTHVELTFHAQDIFGHYSSESVIIYRYPSAEYLYSSNYISEDDDYHEDLYQKDIKVEYNIGTCIVTSVRYKSYADGSGGYINFNIGAGSGGSDYIKSYQDSSITNMNHGWDTYIFDDSEYVIANNPYVIMESNHGTPRKYICADENNITYMFSNSFYRDYDSTGAFSSHSDHEYLVELGYEEVPTLPLAELTYGNIDANDYIDAYFIDLIANIDYEFIMDKIDGTGSDDLSMRIVANASKIGGTTLNSSVVSSYPGSMLFTPPTSGTYVLLVEPDDRDVDHAVYTIICETPVRIISPEPNQIFSDPPPYEVEFKNPFTNNKQYTVGSYGPYIATETGTVNTVPWNNQLDGDVKLNFSADDGDGNVAYFCVTVIKDTIEPSITIYSPKESQYKDAPQFEINADDLYLNEVWYTIGASPTKYYITSNIGTVDSDAWNALSDGEVTITFYADDKAGNQKSESVNVIKDTKLDKLEILAPKGGREFGLPPEYELEIEDLYSSIVEIYFTLNDSSRYNCAKIGTLNEDAWNKVGFGDLNLTFYAKDSAGNVLSQYVLITKTSIKEEEDKTPVIDIRMIFQIITYVIIGSIFFIVIMSIASVTKSRQAKKTLYVPKKKMGGYQFPSTMPGSSSGGYQSRTAPGLPGQRRMQQYNPSQYPSSRVLYAPQDSYPQDSYPQAAPYRTPPSQAIPPRPAPYRTPPSQVIPPRPAPYRTPPSQATPPRAAPYRTPPSQVIPPRPAPYRTPPSQATPPRAAPYRTPPSQATPPRAAPYRTPPSQATPPRTAPYRTPPSQATPPRTAPYRTPPSQATPPRTAPYKAVPYKAVPYKAPQSQASPPRTAPYKAVPYKAVPYKPESPQAPPPRKGKQRNIDKMERQQIPQLQQNISRVNQEMRQLEDDYAQEKLRSTEYWNKKKYLDQKLNTYEEKMNQLKRKYENK